MHNCKIMIVDDSLIAVEKLAAMLRELGHAVVHVSRTGAEAIRDYPLHLPDLVTMDITMPGTDGLAATEAIIAQHPDAKIIIVTSHGQEEMVVRAIDAGACGYVLKPIRKEKLGATIAQIAGPS